MTIDELEGWLTLADKKLDEHIFVHISHGPASLPLEKQTAFISVKNNETGRLAGERFTAEQIFVATSKSISDSVMRFVDAVK